MERRYECRLLVNALIVHVDFQVSDYATNRPPTAREDLTVPTPLG
jgi:hypothetical protein